MKLRENGYQLTLSSGGSYVEKRGTRLNLSRGGKRDMVNLTIYKKIKEASVVTMKGLQREVAKVKKDVKTMSSTWHGPRRSRGTTSGRTTRSTARGVSFALRREACHAIPKGLRRRQ